jgi:hypothetical protein
MTPSPSVLSSQEKRSMGPNTLIGMPPDCAGTSQSGPGDSQVLNGWSALGQVLRGDPQISDL